MMPPPSFNKTPPAAFKAGKVAPPHALFKKAPKAKKIRSKLLLLRSSSGAMTLGGRPDFPGATKKLKVNQVATKGEIEDRRYMLHWDEQLKPLFERVINAMRMAYPHDLYQRLVYPLTGQNWKRLPGGTDELIMRIAKEINGALPNLVADRADLNKAIEHVREYARRYMLALRNETRYESDCLAGENFARMLHYKQLARNYFPTGRSDTPINSRTSELHEMVLEFIDGCAAPGQLWPLMHEIIFSVTFDLSAKARREQTSASLAWLSRMETNVDETADVQYADLLSLLG